MNITTDIQEAIEKNLPAQVSSVLQARLAKCDLLEVEHRDMKEEMVRINNKNLELQAKIGNLEKQAALYEQAQQLMQEAELKGQLVALREKHATERVKEMRDVVKDVFSNRQVTRVQMVDTTEHMYSGSSPDKHTYGTITETTEE